MDSWGACPALGSAQIVKAILPWRSGRSEAPRDAPRRPRAGSDACAGGSLSFRRLHAHDRLAPISAGRTPSSDVRHLSVDGQIHQRAVHERGSEVILMRLDSTVSGATLAFNTCTDRRSECFEPLSTIESDGEDAVARCRSILAVSLLSSVELLRIQFCTAAVRDFLQRFTESKCLCAKSADIVRLGNASLCPRRCRFRPIPLLRGSPSPSCAGDGSSVAKPFINLSTRRSFPPGESAVICIVSPSRTSSSSNRKTDCFRSDRNPSWVLLVSAGSCRHALGPPLRHRLVAAPSVTHSRSFEPAGNRTTEGA
jgi:hypothetical protein